MSGVTNLCAAALLAAAIPSCALASPCENQVSAPSPARRSITARDLVGIRDIGSVSVSPDGRHGAFEVHRGDASSNSYCVEFVVIDLASPSSRVIVDAGDEVMIARGPNIGFTSFPLGTPIASAVKWSPDGLWIAYLKRVGGVVQLWRSRSDGSASLAMVSGVDDVEEFAWGPDSASLLYSSRPDLRRFDENVQREGLTGYLYDERFDPRMGRKPLPRDVPQTINVVELPTGAIRHATATEASVLHPVQAPSQAVTSLSAVSRSGERAWKIRPSGINGRASLQATQRGKEFECLAISCVTGVAGIWWNAAGTEVRFLRREGWANSQTALYRWKPNSKAPVRVFVTDDLIEDCSQTGDDLICSFETSIRPRTLVRIAVEGGKISTLYDPNPEFRSIDLQPAQRLHWRNERGLETYGDLVLPKEHLPGQRHPLIVVGYTTRGFLRGGVGDEYPIQLFVANGYAVLSYARPQDVSDATSTGDRDADAAKDFSNWADRRSVNSAIEEGIDLAISKGAVDPSRVAITGFSDGASTAQWALANSNKYAAASVSQLIDRNGYLVLAGMARSERFKRWGLPDVNSPEASTFWGASEIAAKRGFSTPILVQSSDQEYLTALGTFQALREGSRPVELYVFPGDHHAKWQPAHRLAVYQRNLQWFDFWLMNREATDPLDPNQYKRWRILRTQRANAAKQ